jgi:PEP-CTERM motif
MTKNFLKTVLLAAAGLTIMASAGKAQVVYQNTSNDLLLGFRQNGSTSSVLLDIGPIANFNSAQTFNLGNLGSVLSSNFGSGWATDGNVFFSLAATNGLSNASTNYVTSPETVGGSEATKWAHLTNTNNNILTGKILNMGNAYNAYSAQQTPGNPAVVEPTTDPNAYLKFMPGGTNDAGHASGNIAWGFFSPTTEGNFANGTAGITLDLIQLTATTSTDLGDLTLSSNGSTLTFTPDFAEVPEPSTYSMIALGGLGLCGLTILRNRRAARA